MLASMLVLTIVTYYLAGNGKINNFPTYLAALAFLPFVFVRPDFFSKFNKPLLSLIIIFLFYLCLSSLWSRDVDSLILLKRPGYFFLLITFIFGMAMTCNLYPSFLKWLLVITILSATISSIYSIFLYFLLPDYQPLIEKRLYSLGRLHNPVIAALSYGMAATVCISCLLIHSGRVRVLWIICLAILLLAITLTETRSVWAGLMVSIPVAVFLQDSLSSRRKLAIVGTALGAMFLLAIITWQAGFWDEVLHRATSFRPEIWLTTIQNTLSTNVFFGNGIATSSKLIIAGTSFQHPHSLYIATFFYGGMVGLGLLLLLIGRTFFEVMKIERSPLIILAASSLAFAVVALLFDGNRLLVKVDFLWIVFWFPVSLCLAATSGEGVININWKRSASQAAKMEY